MLQCLTLSLRENGGVYKNAPVIVTIGHDIIINGLHAEYPWLNTLNIEVRWIDIPLFKSESWFATGIERYKYKTQADLMLILDADILICKPFDDLIDNVYENQCFSALIAHYSPFGLNNPKELKYWEGFLDKVGIALPQREAFYSAFPNNKEENLSPNYFNFGVQCAPVKIMNQIGEEFYNVLSLVDEELNEIKERSYFRCQIALTLVLAKLNVPISLMPPKYNFPTDRHFEYHYPNELRDIRLLHTLGETLKKKDVYESLDTINKTILRNDLGGANEVQRTLLQSIFNKLQ
jgi:hypothetical protein